MFFRPNKVLLLAGKNLKSTYESLEQGCQPVFTKKTGFVPKKTESCFKTYTHKKCLKY